MDNKNLRARLFYRTFGFLYDKLITVNGYKRSLTHFLQRLDFPENYPRILDAGCGSGLVSFALLEKFQRAEVVAFDCNKEMVESAFRINRQKKYSCLELLIGDIGKMDSFARLDGRKYSLEEGSFDYAFAAGSLEYSDLKTGVAKLAGILKTGGKLYDIAVRDNFMGRSVGAVQGFRPSSLLEITDAFTQASLREIQEVPFSNEERNAGRIKIVICGTK